MTGYSHTETQDAANQAHFDRWATEYDNDRISPWFRYTQELAISFLDLRSRSKVLDVGCGTGFAVLRLASVLLYGKACGIDISSVMIRQASAKVPSTLRGNVEFLTSSSDQIPYATGTFDHVLCTNSFHHYPDPLRALREMSRVLRPGGQLVILDNAPDLSLYTRAWDYILRIIERGHVRYYSSQELGEMLHRAGFERAQLCHLRNHFLTHRKLFASIQVWRADTPRPSRF
jgi:ubiquinone/menaquinone biosynthesis C-methylase UbiE